MIDLFIAICVAAFFAGAWTSGRYLPKPIAMCFPAGITILVAVFAVMSGLSGVRDWLMAGVAVCVTGVVTAAGRDARKRATDRDDTSGRRRSASG